MTLPVVVVRTFQDASDVFVLALSRLRETPHEPAHCDPPRTPDRPRKSTSPDAAKNYMLERVGFDVTY